MSSNTSSITEPERRAQGVPWSALLALGTAVFITSLTETLPAGVLPQMSSSLHVGSAAAGQSVTLYAAGTALTAIPLARATASFPRKQLLLAAVAVFTIANTLTAAAPGFAVLLVGRFVAGVGAGLAWALLAGYARRIAPPAQEGRAIAIAMTGIPLALSLGVPAGTFIGEQIGWRAAFAAVSALTLAVAAWILLSVPAIPNTTTGEQAAGVTTRRALAVPGIAPIMVVVLTFVLGHTIIYAYVAPYLRDARLGTSVDAILLVFGVACLISIWLTGRHVDTRPRALCLASGALFTAATIAFSATTSTAVVWIAAGLWGLGWGGAPTLLQTAASHAGTRHSVAAADTAQAILVTLWNAAMAIGGLTGGVLLQNIGIATVPITAAALGAASLLLISMARHHAFSTTHQSGSPQHTDDTMSEPPTVQS